MCHCDEPQCLCFAVSADVFVDGLTTCINDKMSKQKQNVSRCSSALAFERADQNVGPSFDEE